MHGNLVNRPNLSAREPIARVALSCCHSPTQHTARLRQGRLWPAAPGEYALSTGGPGCSARMDGRNQLVESFAGVALSLSGFDGLFGKVKRSEHFHANAFPLFPLRKSLSHGLFGVAESPFLDSQVNEGALFGSELNLHSSSVGPVRSPVNKYLSAVFQIKSTPHRSRLVRCRFRRGLGTRCGQALQPRRANVTAVSRPKPLDVPVMRAVFVIETPEEQGTENRWLSCMFFLVSILRPGIPDRPAFRNGPHSALF